MQQAEVDRFHVEDHLPFLDPLISKWFNQKYTGLTDPQKRAIPLIHDRKNVLVSSPTGTGKTLTGFLSVINELFSLAREGKLEDRIYCLYISPLKALANDINKNLNTPLGEIYDLAESEGLKLPKIRVAVRSGDTPQNERQKMLRKPPHILITSPESFSLTLSAPKFREKLQDLRYLIIDEIHEISATKRGALLSVNLERLAAANKDFVRIGLSATQAPLDLIATYLCGYDGDKPRDFTIIDVDTKKFLDLKTITPVNDLTKTSYEVANERMYDTLVKLINDHKTTLVFTNTRSGTEHVAMRLKARGIESIEAHHSSLGKETRIEVENKLKNGELKCVITSTSLELGIDIGYIDLVVQIGSPKSVSKGLQRIGRSGHGIHDLSMGRFLVFDLDDLMECAVLTKAAYDRDIDRVVVPTNSLDVLAQAVVGMTLEKVWTVDEAFSLIRNSYSFHTLDREDFMEVINYLSGRVEDNVIYSKIWYDDVQNTFGKKKSSRMIYFMNVGTIPDEADYKVINEKGRNLGQLSDKFVERLKQGDIFVLGAKTYMYMKSSRNRVYVKDATGMRPTVPSWSGEMLPRSYDLGVLIGEFRKTAMAKINSGEDIRTWLVENYHVDEYGAESLISYLKTQGKFGIPTDTHLLIEGYKDNAGLYNMIFHIPLGRRVNDALSRAFALVISNHYSVNTRVTVTDDGFMLTYEKKIPIKEAVLLLKDQDFPELVRRSLSNTEVFKQRFRHCAARSLMVLRKYKGYDISVARQQLRSDKLLKTLEEMRNFPVIKETFHEIMNDMMDVPRAQKYVKDVIGGKQYSILDYRQETSPFSYGLILAGVSDMVLMEDRSKLLKELQSRILDKVYGSQDMHFLFQSQQEVDEYFRSKVPRINDEASYEKAALHFLWIDPFKNRVNSPYPYAEVAVSDLNEKLINDDIIVSAYIRGTVWTHVDHYPAIRRIFQSEIKLDQELSKVMDSCRDLTFAEIKKETEIEDSRLKEDLSRLESSYMVRRHMRDGIIVYRLNDLYLEDVDLESALRMAVLLLIGSLGPLTGDEISIRLPVSNDLLQPVLDGLVNDGTLVYDYITPVFAKQYIQKSDIDEMTGKGEINDLQARVMNFPLPVADAREYFEKYGYAYDISSIISRGAKVTQTDLEALIADSYILRGRFMKGRNGYVASWLARALFALRYEKENDEEARIFSIIKSGPISEKDLAGRSGSPLKIVRQALRNLEFRLAITRDIYGNFVPLFGTDQEGNRSDAIRLLVEKFGPISRQEIGRNFWLDPDDAIREAGMRAVFIRNDMYYGARKFHVPLGSSALVPVTDPLEIYLGKKYLREIDYNWIIVENGTETASLSMLVRSNVLWVSNIYGTVGNPEGLMASLKHYALAVGSEIIFVEQPPEVLMKPFQEAGFKVSSRSLILGDAEIVDLTEDDLFNYAIMNAQRNEGNIVFEVLKEFVLGVRNEVESAYLGMKNTLLHNYFQSRLLYTFQGPYGIQAYATLDTISLYRSIRGADLDDQQQRVLHAIMELGGATEADVMMHLRRDIMGVKSTIKDLYARCIIARDYDRRYIFVPEKYRKSEAVETILKGMLKNFGFFDENRYRMVADDPDLTEFRKVVQNLVKSGKIIKGITTGIGSMIYVSPGIKEQESRPAASRILIPKDIIMLYFQDYIKSRVGSTNLFLLVENGTIVSGFSARKSERVLRVTKIVGDRSYRDRMKRELNELGFAVSYS